MALSTRRSGRTRFTVLLLVLTAVTLLTLDGRGFGPIDSARSGILSVLSPVGDAGRSAVRPIGNAWDAVFDQGDLQAENDQLREQNDQLQGALVERDAAREQLQQVLELEGLTFTGDLPVARARVVAGSVGNFGQTFDLDQGSRVGIAKGMAVVTGKGFIGKVVQVSDDRSTVELVTSSNYLVGFTVLGTSAVGLAQGDRSPDNLQGINIDVSEAESLQVGQNAITGAGGSAFPAGLPIGTITKVESDSAGRKISVDIRLFADTTDLTYAAVVLDPPS